MLKFIKGLLVSDPPKTGLGEADDSSHAMFEGLFEHAPDAIVVVDGRGRITHANGKAGVMFGYDLEEILGKPVEILMPSRFRSSHVGHRGNYHANPRTREMNEGLELYGVRKNGTEFPVDIMLGPVNAKEGNLVLSIIRDITERKRSAAEQKLIQEQISSSLKEKEVLLKEIHHRVKNNLQIVSTLLNMQSRYIEDPKMLGMFKESRDRVRSMALIHEKLYQSRDLAKIDFSEYVRNMATHLFRSYGVSTDKVTLQTEIKDVYLDIDTAIPCALIINELLTNSLKYAFPHDRTGKLIIEFERSPMKSFLLVRDDGIGFPEDLDPQKVKSLGFQLVCTLSEQLQGRVEARNAGGAEVKIIFDTPKET